MKTSAPSDLEVSNLTKRYNDVVALDDVNLSVKGGEFLTILGASGSGKTTLLKLISGFENPDSGTIRVAGRDITSLSASKRNIGMVFQNYALFPHMTVARNVGFALSMRKVPKSEIARRVTEALQLVELTGYEERFPRQLSGGQQQRVALARAVLFHPSILLLDEPFGALDRKLRETLQLEVRRLQRRLNLTTIFITHDQEEALIMSDRIAVIGKGRLWQVGAPHEIYEAPVNEDVAHFIGESNVLDGAVRAGNSGMPLMELPFGQTIELPAGASGGGGQRRVLIRPERVVVQHPEHGDRTGPTAIVEEKVYIGMSIKYRLRTDNGCTLLARVGPSGEDARFAIGDTVRVSVQSDAVRFVD
jgi:spermidine/putrescine ABC transporter ATP-binding subunit